MGVLGVLTGFETAMTFKVGFDGSNSLVGVQVRQVASEIHPSEYIRLWSFYQTKVVYRLRTFSEEFSGAAMEVVSELARNDFDRSANWFGPIGPAPNLHYHPQLPEGGNVYSGKYFLPVKGGDQRRIRTYWPPFGTTVGHAINSASALLRFAVDQNRGDRLTMNLLGRVARNLVELCETTTDWRLKTTFEVPTSAYMTAVDCTDSQQ